MIIKECNVATKGIVTVLEYVKYAYKLLTNTQEHIYALLTQ